MTLISDATLTWLRAIQLTALPDTVTIQRAAVADDGYSNRYLDWEAATETTVPGRLTASGQMPEEREIAEQVQPAATYTVRVPYGTDVLEVDRILVGGKTYEVLGVLKESYQTVQRVVVFESVELVQPGALSVRASTRPFAGP